MAIRGVSLAEKEDFVLKADPAHEDNIAVEVERRIGGLDHEVSDEERDKIEQAVLDEVGKPTVFFIGNLTKAQRVEIGDMGVSPTLRGGAMTMTTQRAQKNYQTVQYGLKGWDNMLDAEGRAAKFKQSTQANATGGFTAVADDDCMLLLSSENIAELAEAILQKNGMSAVLEKNFGQVSQPSVAQPFEIGTAALAPKSNDDSAAANE